MRLLASISTLAWCISPILANVEKAVFLAPDAIQIPSYQYNLDQLNLNTLAPPNYALRTYLSASFPSPEHSLGTEAWLLLDGLQRYQRYEVRICWAATQPTSFTLNTYSLAEVFDTPDLITSLANFSESHQPSVGDLRPIHSVPSANSQPRSILFLQIIAAADYYSTNETLMQNVPPVKVDIILDPFLLNILPRSLRWTTIYLVGLAILAWVFSSFIWQGLQSVGQVGREHDATRNERAGATSAKKAS